MILRAVILGLIVWLVTLSTIHALSGRQRAWRGVTWKHIRDTVIPIPSGSHEDEYKDTQSPPVEGDGAGDGSSKGEAICRRAIEAIMGQPFKRARPAFLRNHVTGKGVLELDCYNARLKLAVEYNGRQHYEFIPFFHKTKDAFLNQKYRDEMKQVRCADNGVTLIVVPYTVHPDRIRDYIAYRLEREYFPQRVK